MTLKSLNCIKHASVLAAAVLPFAIASVSKAADCSELSHPVYVDGSSAARPFVKQVALKLLAATPPVTIVYFPTGSCEGVQRSQSAGKETPSKPAVVWSAGGTEGTCDLPLGGIKIDVGASDVFSSTCGRNLPTATHKDTFGPIQAMTFVVPKASNQVSISAEAAYLTVGFPQNTPNISTPWTDSTLVFARNETSGTQQMIGAAIRVPAAAGSWPGSVNAGGSGAVLTGVANSTQPDLTLGILSTDIADGTIAEGSTTVSARTKIRILPYQHYGQTCGYLPDSTSTSYDKQNVRDGHYMIWGPLHFISRVEDGEPTNPDAQAFLDLLTGAGDSEEDRVAAIDLAATSHLVPDCAMRVSRDTEVGPLSSYMPPISCECRFLSKATGDATPEGCTPCEGVGDCSSDKPVCNYGFCEVR